MLGVGERLLEGLYVAVPASGGECARRARRVATNKGFARRPQEFLSWEEWALGSESGSGEWVGSGSGREWEVE